MPMEMPESRNPGRPFLLASPLRFASEAAASERAIARSRVQLKRFERQFAASVAGNVSKPAGAISDAIRIAYLRSTPSPGTLAGGAATHINGFVNAATELGAQVT